MSVYVVSRACVCVCVGGSVKVAITRAPLTSTCAQSTTDADTHPEKRLFLDVFSIPFTCSKSLFCFFPQELWKRPPLLSLVSYSTPTFLLTYTPYSARMSQDNTHTLMRLYMEVLILQYSMYMISASLTQHTPYACMSPEKNHKLMGLYDIRR